MSIRLMKKVWKLSVLLRRSVRGVWWLSYPGGGTVTLDVIVQEEPSTATCEGEQP